MADANSNGTDGVKEATKRAVGLFPRLSLSRALELPKAIFELGEGEPVRRLLVFNHMGKSPTSGSSRNLVIAANSGYGVTTGSYVADYLSLTERGRDIVASADQLTKYQAIYDTLFSNSIFAAFIERYEGKSVPNDEVALDYLKQAHKLSEQDAAAALEVIKENIADFGLIREFSGKRIIISREMALEALDGPRSTPIQNVREVSAAPSTSTSTKIASQVPSAISSSYSETKPSAQVHINIEINLPQNATADVYDAIFRSIAAHMLGRQNND